MVIKPENRKLLKEIGYVIWLNTSPEKVYERLKYDDTRPLLKVEDPLKKIKELMFERGPYYRESAGLVVDSDMGGPEEVAEFIFNQLKKQGMVK